MNLFQGKKCIYRLVKKKMFNFCSLFSIFLIEYGVTGTPYSEINQTREQLLFSAAN